MKHIVSHKHIIKVVAIYSFFTIIMLVSKAEATTHYGRYLEESFLGINLGITSGIDYSTNTDEGSTYERTEAHYFANVGGVGRISCGSSIYRSRLYLYGEAGFVYNSHEQMSTGGISDMKDEYTLMRYTALLALRAYIKTRNAYLYVLAGPEFSADYYQVEYDSSKGLDDVEFWKFYGGGGFGIGIEIPFSSFSLDISGRYHLVNSPYFDMTVGLNFYF